MTPDYVLPELIALFDQWSMVADCYHGEKAIKAKGVKYLPDPSPKNEVDDVKAQRYQDYQTRAVFYNVTRKTAKGLSGLVFAKYPIFTVPTLLKPLESDIDGSGQSIVQHAKTTLNSVLLKGRCGLLADYPVFDTSQSQAIARQIQPLIRHFEPENIINWRTTTINGLKKLSLVVLKEHYLKKDDGFKAEYGEQLLVLRLTDGKATSQIYQKDGVWRAIGDETPIKDKHGKAFDTIPFTFVGADNNDETVDDSPLYDLAVLNLAHYRDNADYQESNFIAGQPTLFISGVTNEWFRDVIKPNGGILLGSRRGQILGVGANAQLLQATQNNANFEAMLHKEKQMIALGAKVIEPNGTAKTATQAGGEIVEQTSILSTIANNVSDAYSKCLSWCAMYQGAVGDCILTLNTNYATNKMTAQDRQQLIAEWQAGAITFGEMRAKLVEDEIASIEDSDMAKAEIDSELQGYGINENTNQLGAPKDQIG